MAKNLHKALEEIANIRGTLEDSYDCEHDGNSDGISHEDSESTHGNTSDELSALECRAVKSLMVHSPYTFSSYENIIVYSNGRSYLTESDLEINWPRSPAVEKSTKRISIKPEVPLCDHVKKWKRLRHKKGYTHFFCLECGIKWRKLTNKTE